MGMMDWMDGHEEGSPSDGENTVATDGLGFDDDLDDLSDDFGDFGDGDEFKDGDEFGDDEFGGGGGGGSVDDSTAAELEDRISDLENELSAVSSGMNTVREENKQIGETVEDLDDTIRKLLDIYEMVTRGINPFVDDAREMGGLEGGGAFGIFEGEEEEDEHLDPDVASADAESFFDEDFGEIDAEAGEAELAAEDELAGEERASPADALDDGDESESSSGGGSSFDDLKSEYEENEGWDEELDEDGGAADEPVDESPLDEADIASDDSGVPTTEELVGESPAADETDESPSDGEANAADEPDAYFEDDAEDEAGSDDQPQAFEFDHDAATETPEPEPVERQPAPTQRRSQPRSGRVESQSGRGANADANEGPEYLTALPASYITESVALEWTRFLVSVGGAIGAARALRQYREQEWISRHVERKMNAHVRNAASATSTSSARRPDGRGPSTSTEEPRDLRVEHHKESLTYISRLAGDVAEARLLEELSAHGRRGGRGGLRR
ncbi:flagella accessory protein C [Halopelagius fulvigenes]|uniref:Flagella accessory protein C n=1 Tax=Halopelagius fulvigenes TaxID=1198324 RepID=A0ABD5U0G7_9EURY